MDYILIPYPTTPTKELQGSGGQSGVCAYTGVTGVVSIRTGSGGGLKSQRAIDMHLSKEVGIDTGKKKTNKTKEMSTAVGVLGT